MVITSTPLVDTLGLGPGLNSFSQVYHSRAHTQPQGIKVQQRKVKDTWREGYSLWCLDENPTVLELAHSLEPARLGGHPMHPTSTHAKLFSLIQWEGWDAETSISTFHSV